jgi:hypothetical protein
MKVGAWIHGGGGISLDEQIALAVHNGLQTIRCYDLGYAERSAPALKRAGMNLLGGIHVDAEALVQDWRSQVRLDEMARYHELGVRLEAVCVGNELREGGDEPDKKRFTARLSFGLANVIATYRQWLDKQGYTTPLTYAMEGIVLDRQGCFHEWLWPLIDACDIVGLNLYPMDNAAWFTFGAFEASRHFLRDPRTRHDRLVLFDLNLRQLLQQLEQVDKSVILTETGFPSAVGYHMEGEHLVVPESDNERYDEVMGEFASLIRRANADYDGRIQALYFYEWRDNLHHQKIWNVEQSPIHVAFGLCDRFGVPKFSIQKLVDILSTPSA